jgi:O-antigen/teichoic acid export membrane protein
MQLKSPYNNKIGLAGIRGLSVLAKFIFTILFFKYSEAAFGEYSLIATTIVLLVFVTGLDFYSYANRAVLEPDTNTQKIIFNQFGLYFILYPVLFPVVYIIFKIENFDLSYLLVFYLVLITEHLNTEFYRLLFVFKKPFTANINLFLRNGLWVIAASVYIFLFRQISIRQILYLWLSGNILALIYTLITIYRKRHKIIFENFKWDTAWIKTGITISLPYILATISYKIIEFSDRYMIDYFMDKKAVGIYSFFSSIANVLNILLFTLVISVLYPVLVENIMQHNRNQFKKTYKLFKKEILYYGSGFALVLSVTLPIILMIIQKEIYLHDYYVFLILLIGNFFLNGSFIYHFIIYAYKKDWKILKATFAGAIVNIVFNLILIPAMGIGGAAIATFLGFATILFIKYIDAKKYLPIKNQGSTIK